ncbi:glycosyltransferase [Micrococcus luteus]|uniref:glycosyltransferase n=1 Tax=Micrococcus luteus TaxID=1270 RepID=UPI0015D960EB|nr:glycosyltransferase family A protein [Micrococcus luteus]
MNTDVSVVIPCYNVEKWIEGQVGALLPQLGPDDELVLVDNRSTDGSAEILERLSRDDPRVRVVQAFDRAGVNHARNTGLRAARNDVILICDADDRVHPGWVEAFRQALRDGGIAGGVVTPVDADGRRIGPDRDLHEIFHGPAYPIGANMGLTRDVLEAVHGFDESFVGGHDEADFAWRAARAGFQTHAAPGARIDYLQRPDARSALTQRRNYARTAIQLWARHPDVADRNGVSLKGAVRGVLTGLPTWLKVRRGTATLDEASSWGWSLGLLEGHLRYRVLGRPPQPLIPPSQEGTAP